VRKIARKIILVEYDEAVKQIEKLLQQVN
jgi:hypothetical protein